mmetsp:Transcript_6865/g.12170  ORF Transcript_6865/g.12170 Transcript_6865/m.12170 type:complete len:209 (+) Transcript_6865:170-796(+)
MKVFESIMFSVGMVAVVNSKRLGDTGERQLLAGVTCNSGNQEGLKVLFKFHADNLDHKCVAYTMSNNGTAVAYGSETIEKSFWHMDESKTWECFTGLHDIDRIDVTVKNCKCDDLDCLKDSDNLELSASINPNQYAWVDYSASYYYFAAWYPVCSSSCNKCINPGDATVSPVKDKTSTAEGYYCGTCIQIDQCVAPNPPVAAPTMSRR